MRSDGAFTLIELLIVSAIILVLVSFSTPLFQRTFSDLELKETVSNISRLIAFAQEKAIIERRLYKISFDFENRTYRLFAAAGEGENISFVNSKDRFGRIFYVPRSLEIDGSAAEIVFYPEGRSDIVELRLTNKNNKVSTIAVTGTLGNVVVSKE